MDISAKRLFRQFIYSLAAFTLTLIFVFIAAAFFADYPPTPARIVVVLAPVIPVVFTIIFFLRYLGKIDELQQRIQLIAIGFSAGTTSMLAFSYGVLETVGFPQISLLWVLPVMVLFWAIGLAFISRRYK